MPNPSNSDLVGEAIHAEAEWLKVEFGQDVDADTQESNASNLGDDEWLDLAAASPLAQQLEQAEQHHESYAEEMRADYAEVVAESVRYKEALEKIETLCDLSGLDTLTARYVRAALTTPDPPVEEEGANE